MHVFFYSFIFFLRAPLSFITLLFNPSRHGCAMLISSPLWPVALCSCLLMIFFFCRIFAVPVANTICIYKQRRLKHCTPGDNANAHRHTDAQRGVYSKCLWQAYQHSDPLWQPHFTVTCKISQVSTCYVTKKKCCRTPTKKVNWLSFCSDYWFYASCFSTFSAKKDIRILMRYMLHLLLC